MNTFYTEDRVHERPNDNDLQPIMTQTNMQKKTIKIKKKDAKLHQKFRKLLGQKRSQEPLQYIQENKTGNLIIHVIY